MTARQATIKVEQRWLHTDNTGAKRRLIYEYIVLQTRNTTTPPIHAKLTKEQVDELIQQGYDVTIVDHK